MTKKYLLPITRSVCLGGALLGAPAIGWCDDPATADKLAKDNEDLRIRVAALEAMAQKEGLISSKQSADPPVSAMSDITLSGFVTFSYFHDSSDPHQSKAPPETGSTYISPGYLWNRVNDSFSLNKVKITLASPPVQASGDKFDAAYRVSLIAGQDAPIVNTSSSTIGFDWLREAYVEMNVPIGTGLNVRAGELISLLNYESGDGGAANDNFSQGFQWFFTGNPPAGAIQLGYSVTDWLGVKFRVQNGLYAGPIDNNRSKTLVGSVDLKPGTNAWVTVLGFGGVEDAGFTESLWGASILAGWQVTPAIALGTELDYFLFQNPGGGPVPSHSPVYSGGLWAHYDFSKEVRLAVRGEFLSDSHGVDASGGALGFSNPVGTGQDLSSVALTLDYMPIPRIKIQPEVRFDHTSYAGGFVPGKQNRVIFGAGASYLF